MSAPNAPVWETVTPKMAEKWLNANNSNRSLTPGVVEKYAADMLAGRWTECIVPLAFYADLDIADGQHRLYAVIESNTTQRFLVLRGLSRAAGLNIDTGRGRTLVDNARISGSDGALSNQLVAYARGIEDGAGGANKRARSHAELLEIVNKHRAAADWAMRNGPSGRGVRNAAVVAAVGRAYYHEADHERLARFSSVLSTGHYDSPSDTAAIALRNYLLLKMAARVSLVSNANWRDTFLKAQNAVRYFMQHKQLNAIRTVSDEAYPLAGRKANKAPTTTRGQRALAKAEKRATG